jgi:hypothetical protein
MTEQQNPLRNLMQRINEVRRGIGYVQKDKNVSTGTSGSYKAVTHDQVTALVRSHMIDAGIVCYPVLVASRVADTMDKDGKLPCRNIRYEATYDFTFANCDDPKDAITLRIESHAMDNQDKAPGKALSYAKKYAILKLFEIETGEDDESRVKETETFDLLSWSEKIDAATSKDVLQYIYLEAKKDAVRLNDAPALKTLGQHVKKVLETKYPEAAK